MADNPTARLDPAPDELQDFWSLTVSAAGIGTWRWEREADQLVCSDRCAVLMGLDNSRPLRYRDFISRIHPHEREIVDQSLRENEADQADLDCRVISGEGRSRWLRLKAAWAPGFHRLHGIAQPINRDPRNEIADSQLAAIVACSEDAIISKTLDGIVTSWNRGAEKIFGYRADEMIGQSIARILPDGENEEMYSILTRIRRGERLQHYETLRRRKDGLIVPVSLSVSPIYAADGTLIGASKIARDISALKRSEAALRDSNTQLQALQIELNHVSRLSAMGQMAAMLAHEINQPLTAVTNYMKAGRRLLDGSRPIRTDKLREAMDRAGEQATRAGQIIRRLREFLARGETEKRIEDLPTIIEESAALIQIGDSAGGAEISLRLDGGAVFVIVDKIQIQQVLVNLLRNAVEAMMETRRPSLYVTTEKLGEMVEVSVTDSGPGLAPEVAEQLFQPFVTTKRSGMGIGLSVCRSIIEAHGGHLWYEPNPQGGAIFRFTLMAVEKEEEDSE